MSPISIWLMFIVFVAICGRQRECSSEVNNCRCNKTITANESFGNHIVRLGFCDNLLLHDMQVEGVPQAGFGPEVAVVAFRNKVGGCICVGWRV